MVDEYFSRGPHYKQDSIMTNYAHLIKNANLSTFDFWQFLQKWSTWPMHNSLNFDPREVFLDFLEILGCLPSNRFGLISNGSSMFM